MNVNSLFAIDFSSYCWGGGEEESTGVGWIILVINVQRYSLLVCINSSCLLLYFCCCLLCCQQKTITKPLTKLLEA
jgi:hypothetical protein